MAVEIIWSLPAISDAENIAAYIARDSEAYAANMIRRIVENVEMLATFPRMGRQVPELNREQIRELIVWPYRVIYRVEAVRVEIAAIVHGARLLENAIVGRKI